MIAIERQYAARLLVRTLLGRRAYWRDGRPVETMGRLAVYWELLPRD